MTRPQGAILKGGRELMVVWGPRFSDKAPVHWVMVRVTGLKLGADKAPVQLGWLRIAPELHLRGTED